MGSEQNRFPQQERRKGWGGCWGAFSCFGTQKGGKRIVPSSRIPEGNALATQPNVPPAAGLSNQATTLAPSLLAPPSSPASFTNSALPSTAQSPACCLSLSANSPGGPASTMFTIGPYAHETQLVSPPVFSAFTTEPSTAPLTPPPELAHLTTPSSPDVPFAQFFTSSMNIKSSDKTNYIAANYVPGAYSPYSGSPASSIISPKSRTSGDCLSSSFPEREFLPQWVPSVSPQNGKYSRSGSGRLTGHEPSGPSVVSQDTNFFCPDTFARFYRDNNPPFPHTAGRLSVSKDSDTYSTGGNGCQSKTNKTPKQDVEELEAYRASFGFSADEIITTPQYVEISDVAEETFTMTPFSCSKSAFGGNIEPALLSERVQGQTMHANLLSPGGIKSDSDLVGGHVLCEETKSIWRSGSISGLGVPTSSNILKVEDDVYSNVSAAKLSRKYHLGLSSSDAEIDYRRGRSLREGKRDISRHN